jgi:hypothetical protein
MVIAALIVFGALLAAWFLAPAERARVAQSPEQHSAEVAAPLTAGLAKAA